jgi:mitochondrial fission protein ELM1
VFLELASGIYPRSRDKIPSIPDIVASIFAISDIIIVTEDSFSMVCEAASSGKKIIILNVDRKSKRLPRRHRTYNSIMQYSQIVRCNIDNLEDTLLKVANEDLRCKALRDADKAAEAIIQMIRIKDGNVVTNP